MMMKNAPHNQGISSKVEKVNKVTKDTLYKEHPDENAEIFLQQIQKSRASHLKKVQDKDLMFYAIGNQGGDSPSSPTFPNNEDFGCPTEEQFKEGLEKGGAYSSSAG